MFILVNCHGKRRLHSQLFRFSVAFAVVKVWYPNSGKRQPLSFLPDFLVTWSQSL
jgi:hypothetical protein